MIPFLLLAYYLPISWSHLLATAIFALAAVTDWFDGYLARRLGQASQFGAFLDPVADKLIVAVALIILVQSNPTLWFVVPASVIVGREIAISALREWMAEIGERAQVAVSMIGKIKTTVQMTALLLLLYRDDVWMLPTHATGIVLLYLAAALTLWSMVIYLRAAWPILTSPENS
jgi:CDP-diacylglycerol--glycerol-3-phosphate 3-phosphatidyltransferase/cardiolipin synthase